MDLVKKPGDLESDSSSIKDAVEQIRPVVEEVKDSGDEAVRKYTREFDGVSLDRFELKAKKQREAVESLTDQEKEAIRDSIDRIRKFHALQMPEEWTEEFPEGFTAGEVVRPLERVGCYIPGGNYPLPSSVLMTVVPAVIAGVDEIVVCAPPGKDGIPDSKTVAAAELAGADRIFSIGGSQAIAAMAYGTESVPKVDKIVGPGNKYVTAAKKLVYGEAGVDFLAGPSEVLIISDGSSDPAMIASDLLAQAEHDTDARPILVTTDQEIASEVEAEISRQLEELPTAETASKALRQNGGIVLAEDLEEAVRFSNTVAPEHLELQIENPEIILDSVRNAGTVFVGERSAEVLGDYTTGTNHVLPTGGSAKFRGGLSARDFVKIISWERQSEESLKALGETAKTMADIESLPGHRKSVERRLEK